jgi:AraC-like DNA-binding protein
MIFRIFATGTVVLCIGTMAAPVETSANSGGWRAGTASLQQQFHAGPSRIPNLHSAGQLIQVLGFVRNFGIGTVGFSVPQATPMVGSGTATFTDPGDYRGSITGASINLVQTGGGEFKARLTWVKLRHLRMGRGRENVSHITFVKSALGTVLVAFPISFKPPQIWGGANLSRGDIVIHGLGGGFHQRTSGASQWGFVSLAPKDLAAYGRALLGVDLVPPPAVRILRPPAGAVAHLLRLHAQACRLAETKPGLIPQREVARAMEQDLLPALFSCLIADDAYAQGVAWQRRASIMDRLETVLETHCSTQLDTRALCAAIDVPERTLRVYCAESLGMSPGSYVRLRRLNFARATLQRSDPATGSVAQTAKQYGFSELGRFAAVYRRVFGKPPSATLWGPHKLP